MKSADNLFCSCTGQYGHASTDRYHGKCVPCYYGCATCETANLNNDCQSCLYNFPLSSCVGNSCTCPCQANCPTTDQLEFLQVVKDYSLPYTTETGGMICYRQQVQGLNCNPLPVMVSGSLASTGGLLQPTLNQCDELLEGQWAWTVYWFGQLFPNFTPPAGATAAEITLVKSTLYALILKQGPNLLTGDATWTNFLSNFNTKTPNWGQIFGWPGPTNGYTTNGSTVKALPTGLTLTPTSLTLVLLTKWSTVCNTAGCPLATQCQLVSTSYACK